jgi:hypothetical protein
VRNVKFQFIEEDNPEVIESGGIDSGGEDFKVLDIGQRGESGKDGARFGRQKSVSSSGLGFRGFK